MKQFIPLLKLIRLPNLVIVGFTQFWSAVFLVENQSFQTLYADAHLYLLIISTLFIAAAGYLINDYYDIKIDYINRPGKVIIGKHIERRKVIIGHSVFNFIGVALGAWVSWWIMALNMLAAFLLWLYSNLLKRLPLWGNLAVSLLTALTVVAIYILYQTNLAELGMYAVFAFFISLVREIIKDAQDVEGDEKFGCRTLPIVLGIANTKKIVYFLLVVFWVIAGGITRPWPMFYPFMGGLSLMLLLFCFKLIRADKKQDFAWLSSYAKLMMVMGILSMILL